jgi:ribosomal protein S18 acetylase RimI-like enzyme
MKDDDLSQALMARAAQRSELPAVLRVQHQAFERVSLQLGIAPEGLPPLGETLGDLEALMDAGARFFVATAGEKVVGTVRAVLRLDGVVEIGRLGIADGYERRGIASALMRCLEDSYPDVARFELFTGADAAAPLALYTRRGYAEFEREGVGRVVLVWLAKDRAHNATT